MSTTRFVLLGLVLAAGASCFEATPPKTYPCTAAHPECPAGLVCRGERCVDPASTPDCRAVDGPTQLDQGYCGDGVKNGTEECDGKDLGGATCEKLCYGPGQLVCKACKLSTAGCSSPKDRPEDRWVLVEKGTIVMGSPKSDPCRDDEDDEDQHQVTLTRSFWMQATEVTRKQFSDRMGFDPSYDKKYCKDPDCPVEWVFWVEAAAYCNALSIEAKLPLCYVSGDSKQSCESTAECPSGMSCAGKKEPEDNRTCKWSKSQPAYQGDKIYSCPGYRLPTEAEWELAYRHKTTTDLFNGQLSTCFDKDANADRIAWYKHNSGLSRQPVASKQPNGNCLFDMAGNLWEWCHDGYRPHLGSAPVTDPVVTTVDVSKGRVLRGGAFHRPPHTLRAAERAYYPTTNSHLGFRCVRTHLPAQADGGPSSD